MKTPTDIHWLRINAQPVKVHLGQFVVKWKNKYSNYLHDYVEERIDQLVSFVDKVMVGLTSKSPADEPEDEKAEIASRGDRHALFRWKRRNSRADGVCRA